MFVYFLLKIKYIFQGNLTTKVYIFFLFMQAAKLFTYIFYKIAIIHIKFKNYIC